jgi:hypothetical protein
MAWGVLKISRASLAELLDTFSPFVMPPLLVRVVVLSAYVHKLMP